MILYICKYLIYFNFEIFEINHCTSKIMHATYIRIIYLQSDYEVTCAT
jgi:hypothetical protein